jgi:Xaa-Pro aminopeptidase
VVEAAAAAGGEKPLNTFETLTLVPIDRRLIDTSMLSSDEYAWLEIYHAKVAEALVPLVGPETRPWLDAATRPLGQA